MMKSMTYYFRTTLVPYPVPRSSGMNPRTSGKGYLYCIRERREKEKERNRIQMKQMFLKIFPAYVRAHVRTTIFQIYLIHLLSVSFLTKRKMRKKEKRERGPPPNLSEGGGTGRAVLLGAKRAAVRS